MTDVQMKSFLTLAEELNFTKASKRLCISQSTLSTHISSLEKNLAITLFIRTNKNVVLSPEGQLLYPVFRQAYEMIEQGVKDAKKLHEGHANKLRIGILNGLRLDMILRIMEIIRDFRNLYPSTEIEMISVSDNQNLDMLDKNQLDIAITFSRSIRTKPEFEGKIMLENQLCLLYPSNKYNDANPFSLESVENETLIVVSRESGPSEESYLREFQEKVGKNFLKVMRVNSTETKLFFISAGYGIGFSDHMTRLIEPEKYGQFQIKDIMVQYGFICRKNTKNRLVKNFFEYLNGEM